MKTPRLRFLSLRTAELEGVKPQLRTYAEIYTEMLAKDAIIKNDQDVDARADMSF